MLTSTFVEPNHSLSLYSFLTLTLWLLMFESVVIGTLTSLGFVHAKERVVREENAESTLRVKALVLPCASAEVESREIVKV